MAIIQESAGGKMQDFAHLSPRVQTQARAMFGSTSDDSSEEDVRRDGYAQELPHPQTPPPQDEDEKDDGRQGRGATPAAGQRCVRRRLVAQRRALTARRGFDSPRLARMHGGDLDVARARLATC